MRLLSIIVFLICVEHSSAQQRSQISFADEVALTLTRDTFESKGSAIEFGRQQISHLHKQKNPIFETDGGMPRTYLKKAVLTIGTRSYDFQVDGMYDPWFDDRPVQISSFKLKTEEYKYKIRYTAIRWRRDLWSRVGFYRATYMRPLLTIMTKRSV